jgi:NAD(P)-dependent dehydrogenase (short-subunit alcohol dehydrogenase family)
MPDSPKTILILSVSSDIGLFLAQQYLSLGHRVIGTYRSDQAVKTLSKNPQCHLLACDIHEPHSLTSFVEQVKALGVYWDTLISCVGDPLPVQPFFDADFDQWQQSVEVNSLDQLRAVHMLYPLRNAQGIADVVFFAAGGANNAVVNLSAYTIGKIMLTKMCEFLDAENPDLNVFIVGPGWTKTKVHQKILNDPHVSKVKFEETQKFMQGKEGTSLDDIFNCIQWLCAQGRSIAGGRNFSVVHDPWRAPQREKLIEQLKANGGMYKLRRHNNDFMQ